MHTTPEQTLNRSSFNFEKGSFKDPEGRIAYSSGRILRLFSEQAAQRFQKLSQDGRLLELVRSGLLIPYTLRSAEELEIDPSPYSSFVLEHPPLRFISYPYEWSFSMLQDAALTNLELMRACLKQGLSLKDATPFNVALFEGKMIFIDSLSITDLQEGKPWPAYGQFCREFLFPLLLTAYRGIDFQEYLRSSLTGIDVSTIAAFFPWTTWHRKGVFKHVVVQNELERQFKGQNISFEKNKQIPHFPPELLVRLINSLYALVKSLHNKKESKWSHYSSQNSYDEKDNEIKKSFIKKVFSQRPGKRLIDLGCNTGNYSLDLHDKFDLIIGIDADPLCIDHLYLKIKDQKIRNYYPIVNNLLNPSPTLGWDLQERKSILERVSPDSFLALALIHHICISGNVPLAMCIAHLRKFGKTGVIEWVDKKDSMVKRLLLNREDIFEDYNWDNFINQLELHFSVGEIVETHGGHRKLVQLNPL